MKLQIKIILIVVGIMAGVGILVGTAIIMNHRSITVSYFQHFANMTAVDISISLEQDMIKADIASIQEALFRAGKTSGISAIAIYGKEGRLFASVGNEGAGAAETALRIKEVLSTGVSTGSLGRLNGKREYRTFLPVFNKQECRKCHEPSQRILGVIQTNVDASSLDTQLTEQALMLLGYAMAGFVAVSVILSFTLRRLIVRRLSRLSDVMKKVKTGDYAQRIKEEGKDEISVLASSFNGMAESLKQRTDELLGLQKQLEERVQQREREIRATADINLKVLNERVQLLEEAKRATAQVSRLYKMISLIWNQQEPLERARECLNIVQQETGAEYGSLTLVNSDGTLGERVDSFRGMKPLEVQTHSGGLLEQILLTRETQYVQDTSMDIRANPTLLEAGIHSYIGFPLLTEGQVAGILFLHSIRTDAFQKYLQFLSAISELLAISLTSVRILRQ